MKSLIGFSIKMLNVIGEVHSSVLVLDDQNTLTLYQDRFLRFE